MFQIEGYLTTKVEMSSRFGRDSRLYLKAKRAVDKETAEQWLNDCMIMSWLSIFLLINLFLFHYYWTIIRLTLTILALKRRLESSPELLLEHDDGSPINVSTSFAGNIIVYDILNFFYYWIRLVLKTLI